MTIKSKISLRSLKYNVFFEVAKSAFLESRSADTFPENRAHSPWSNRKLLAACALLFGLAGAAAVWNIVSQNRHQASADILASLWIKPLIRWNAEAGEGSSGARFSPNGTMIAYSLTRNGQRNIWTKKIPDGKAHPITDGKWNYYNPLWSFDGQRIAFLSNRDNKLGIWSMPFTGGALTLIKAIESNAVDLLHWSKNGATVYYRQGFNLFALDIASRQTTQLTNFDSTDPAQFFSLSPDETRIAYASGANERLHIFVMDLSGGNRFRSRTTKRATNIRFGCPTGSG